jgi:putative Holliday junction resolvase
MKIAFKMKTYNILSIEDLKSSIGRKSRLLGIDPGLKNIGIAICDENQKIATPFKTVQKGKLVALFKEINQIIDDNHIKGIIIGNPINMDGSLGKSSQSVFDFAKNLSKNIAIPVSLWDERLSSEGSFSIVKDLNTSVTKKIEKIDRNAAAFILQGAIDYLTN